jgi:hypothetical protein
MDGCSKTLIFFRLITFWEILKFITIYKTETSDKSSSEGSVDICN